jgi:hypothetical protein
MNVCVLVVWLVSEWSEKFLSCISCELGCTDSWMILCSVMIFEWNEMFFCIWRQSCLGPGRHERLIGLMAKHSLCNGDWVVPRPQCRPDTTCSIIMSCWVEAEKARCRSGWGWAGPRHDPLARYSLDSEDDGWCAVLHLLPNIYRFDFFK